MGSEMCIRDRTYVGELAFNLLVLVGAIKGCDRIVKEIMGL